MIYCCSRQQLEGWANRNFPVAGNLPPAERSDKRDVIAHIRTGKGWRYSEFLRRDLDRVSMARIIFPRRNRGNDRQRMRDRSRPTYIPVYHSRRSTAFIKLYLDPLSRGIRRGISSVNARVRRFCRSGVSTVRARARANPSEIRRKNRSEETNSSCIIASFYADRALVEIHTFAAATAVSD